MNEKFEYQGYWWLPGAGEDKVPGILKFDPDNGATLNLLGSLKGFEGLIDPLDPEIILGLSSDGKLITLKDCGRTLGSLAFGSGFSTSSVALRLTHPWGELPPAPYDGVSQDTRAQQRCSG